MGIDNKKLSYLEYVNRENSFVHPSYQEDMLQYIYLKNGDNRAIEEAVRNFDPAIQGRISGNDLRNSKYLFVAATTLACRYAIEGGADQKGAYSASDLYIRQMDLLEDEKHIAALHEEMIRHYLSEVQKQKARQIHALPVLRCIDYIYDHLNSRITMEELADHVRLHPNYLSALFKKETGMTVTSFIQSEKVKTACNMLKYTDYSYSDISSTLDFSSQSYFIKVFKDVMGMTPREYREE